MDLFFFQAEDGIRDKLVTGVQTCALPISNADLERMVETSDTWIRDRTGIAERRIAAVNETATDLAAEAAKDALAIAGLRPQDTDLIVCSTSTPDSMFPSVASRVQERLPAPGPPLHVQAACTRLLYA